jgi:heat shock protein HslJ
MFWLNFNFSGANMQNKKYLNINAGLVLAVGMLAGLTACSASKPVPPDNHTSQIALDWAGGYYSALAKESNGQPDGAVSLWLAPNGGYRLDLENIKGIPRQSYTGKVKWIEGKEADLRGAPPEYARWLVQENQLLNATKGWAAKHVPALVAALALPDQWTLTDLAGDQSDLTQKPPELTFNMAQRVFGFDGCNRLMGRYQLDANGNLSFKPLAGTLMACMQPTPERAFRAMLEKVADAKIQGETLEFFAADGKKLAQFRATSSQALPSVSRQNNASRPE